MRFTASMAQMGAAKLNKVSKQLDLIGSNLVAGKYNTPAKLLKVRASLKAANKIASRANLFATAPITSVANLRKMVASAKLKTSANRILEASLEVGSKSSILYKVVASELKKSCDDPTCELYDGPVSDVITEEGSEDFFEYETDNSQVVDTVSRKKASRARRKANEDVLDDEDEVLDTESEDEVLDDEVLDTESEDEELDVIDTESEDDDEVLETESSEDELDPLEYTEPVEDVVETEAEDDLLDETACGKKASKKASLNKVRASRKASVVKSRASRSLGNTISWGFPSLNR